MPTNKPITQFKLLGRCLGALLLLLGLSLAVRAQSINFEGTNGQLILNQYASQGVTFNGPLGTDFTAFGLGFAHSGSTGIQLCFAQEFCSAPLQVNFTTGQAHVKLWIGYIAKLDAAQNVTLQAKDGNGALIDQITVTLASSPGPIRINTPMEINSGTANIRQLELRFDAGPGVTTFNNGLLIDDVEFSALGPAPACGTTDRPVVTVIQPQPNPAVVAIDEFMLQGSVQTNVPLDEATLTVTRPDSTVKSFSLLGSSIALNGGPFGATRINGMLLPGVNTVVVRVRNCVGPTSVSRSVNFTPIPADARFQFLGMEVTQVTQDLQNTIPLVADKPTLVRVYLQVTGTHASISRISGAITATRPGGTTVAPLLHSINTITVESTTSATAQRLNINATLNFLLPRHWIAPSTLHFELSKLYVQDRELNLPCDGCQNLDGNSPRYAVFRATKPLNLVLAPYTYTRSATGSPDLIFTPMGTLQWLNNVYPISGSFPGESGIRLLRYLPVRQTGRNLASDDDGGDFLDDLEEILCDLRDQNGWPSDTRLMAMTPFGGGGRARTNGTVNYVDTWAVENGPVPEGNFEGYGSTWAQELGHNLGRNHYSNAHGEQSPTDPQPGHGGIGYTGAALSTRYWLASTPSIVDPGAGVTGSSHTHDFMSYGHLGPAAEHKGWWTSPYTYKALFKKFEDLAPVSMMAVTPRIEKLVVSGKIKVDGSVTLRPFRRVVSSYVSQAATNSGYSVVLRGANGRQLLSSNFEPEAIEDSKILSFNTYVPWKKGTEVIEIRRGARVVAKRSVSKNAPWVKIITPVKGATWGKKATISWSAGDADRDELTYSVFYNSGLDATWLPIANGVKETSTMVDTSLLAGSPRARIRVRATDGVNTTEAESEIFGVEEKKPSVAILSPATNKTISPDSVPNLVGAAYDPEDGLLPITSLTWTSDRDGLLASGKCDLSKPLSRGRHVITLTAVDSSGNTARAQVNIMVR